MSKGASLGCAHRREECGRCIDVALAHSSSGSSDQLPGSCRLPTMTPSAREFMVALTPLDVRPLAR